jgi:hypothetical protein
MVQRFLKLLVLHEHHCNRQVQQEERANNHTADEVEVDEQFGLCVFVDVHYMIPPFQSDRLKDCQERIEDVVEVCNAVIQLFDLRIYREVILNKVELLSLSHKP